MRHIGRRAGYLQGSGAVESMSAVIQFEEANHPRTGKLRIALAGNPNCGKTTVFNAYTGARQHVGNYPGVTVDRKEGQVRHGQDEAVLVDLPGTYSLTAYSMEELVARAELSANNVQAVINVVDASALERNLLLTVQMLEMGLPLVLGCNMMDEARAAGLHIDVNRLSGLLGVPVVPMVYTILRANALVARYVDSGSMAALLAAPVPRSRVVRTQLGALYSGIVLLVGYCTAVEWASARLLFPGELAAAELLRMNAGLLALQLLIGSVCFFFSCLCDDTRGSIALGAGLPTLMYLVQMLANMGGKLEPFRYATFFTLYDPTALAAGQAAGWQGAAVLLAAALVLNLAAGAVFRRKDLPL